MSARDGVVPFLNVVAVQGSGGRGEHRSHAEQLFGLLNGGGGRLPFSKRHALTGETGQACSGRGEGRTFGGVGQPDNDCVFGDTGAGRDRARHDEAG